MDGIAGKAAWFRGIIAAEVVEMREVVLKIPEEVQEVLGARRDLAKEIMKRLAVSLYAERKVSLGKAVELSGTDYPSFMRLMADFGVCLDYDEDDLASDVETIGRLRRSGHK